MNDFGAKGKLNNQFAHVPKAFAKIETFFKRRVLLRPKKVFRRRLSVKTRLTNSFLTFFLSLIIYLFVNTSL